MTFPKFRLPAGWLAAAALAAVLAADVSPAAAQDGAGGGDRPGRARRFHRFRAMQKFRHAQRRHAVADAMALTADQQRLVAEKSRAAQPIVAEARRETAKVLAQRGTVGTNGDGTKPTAEDRAARRAALRDIRTRTSEKLAPLAKDVLASLTPEQKAKLEGLAAARGRKLDETKLTRRVGRWLARPMTADLMEAKLGTR
jgi:hypothetical protein